MAPKFSFRRSHEEEFTMLSDEGFECLGVTVISSKIGDGMPGFCRLECEVSHRGKEKGEFLFVVRSLIGLPT